MKLTLNLVYKTYIDYENRELIVTPTEYESDYDIIVRCVTVDIPDGIDLTEKEFNYAVQLRELSVAEKEVEVKRRELHKAEEIVKNMLALPAEIIH
jgi:hypothetical protein